MEVIQCFLLLLLLVAVMEDHTLVMMVIVVALVAVVLMIVLVGQEQLIRDTLEVMVFLLPFMAVAQAVAQAQ
tara:strand:+ start:122 stop:337 length:216 start_codon:yes stop_codon:yes gene_type:complete